MFTNGLRDTQKRARKKNGLGRAREYRALRTLRVVRQRVPILYNMKFLARYGFAAVIVFETVVASPAQEWTRFRGPNGTGISEARTIPTTWTDKDFNWKTALPGVGHSAPVLWGDRIFLTSA